MILVCDSGSTKADWIAATTINDKQKYSTDGINPVFQNAEEIQIMLEANFSSICNGIEQLYFYGAGCLKGKNTIAIEKAFQKFFNKAQISIDDDMIGAARALFSTSAGIAAILGTGANSCLYVDGKIIDKVPALGFILGDEGSGAYLGKHFINAHFKRTLPKYLAEKFAARYNIEISNVIEAVYRQAAPNRYLASFAPFLIENKTDEFVKQFLIKCFYDFIEKNISKYADCKNYKIGMCGSIAYYFKEEIEIAMKNFGLNLVEVLQKPIDKLVEFHLNNKI